MAKLHRIGFYHKKLFINTENPEKEIWDRLLMLGDINYLKRKWEGRGEDEYIYVASHIRQAFEFNFAAKKVGISTKPLLMYYSFLNLSTAILSIRNDKIPSSKYHGLESPTITGDFLDTSTKVNDGIFLELLKINSDSDKIKKGDSINIRMMYENFLELNDYYCDYFGCEKNFLTPNVNIYLDGDIAIFPNKDGEILKKRLTGYILKKDETNTEYFYKNIGSGEGNIDEVLSNEFKGIFEYKVVEDGVYYINKNTNSISSISSIYGIIFILGNIVRYKPEYLMQLSNSSDGMSQLLNKTFETSNRVFPNLLLNLAYGQDVIFSKNLIF